MLVYQRGTPITSHSIPIKLNNLYYNSIKSQKKSMKNLNFHLTLGPMGPGIRRYPPVAGQGSFRCWRNFCFSCLKMGLFVREMGAFAASQYDEWTIFSVAKSMGRNHQFPYGKSRNFYGLFDFWKSSLLSDKYEVYMQPCVE